MALSFPINPTPGQTYTYSGRTWVWTGSAWKVNDSGAINGIPIGNVTPASGSFTTLTANSTVNLGNVANVKILGGANAQVLITDGTGNLSWSDGGGGGLTTITVDSFVGNGSNTTFTLTATPQSKDWITVNLNGVLQLEDAYSVSGNVLTLDSAPAAGVVLDVRIVRFGSEFILENSTIVAVDDFVGDGTTTSYTLSVTPQSRDWVTVNYNGVILQQSSFTLAGNVITFNSAPANSSAIEISTVQYGAVTTLPSQLSVAGPGNVTVANVTNIVFSGAGVTVSGSTANATVAVDTSSANTAVTVTGNAQANITSVGTLTGLTVNGNVGIGNITPGKQLDIANTNTAELRVRTTSTPVDVLLTAEYTSYGAGSVGTATEHGFEIRSNSIPRMVFGATGNIFTLNANLGMDVFPPTEKLDVSGNVKATGFIGSGAGLTSLPAANVTGNLSGVANITASGNLAFTGTGTRITGDFSNVTHLNRTMFQTSVANSATVVGAIPNGTSAVSVFRAFNTADPTNSPFTEISANPGDSRLTAGALGSGTALPLTFYAGGSERMRLDTAGNLGLGIAPSAWGSGWRAVQLQTYGSVYDANAGNVGVAANAFFNGTNWVYRGNTVAFRYDAMNGGNGHAWFTAPSGTAGNVISFTQAMTLDASGNLGIGTNSPAQRLDINSTADVRARLLLDGTAIAQWQAVPGEARLHGIGSNVLGFWTNGGERMRIDSSGNLLLGTTSAGASGITVGDGRTFNFAGTGNAQFNNYRSTNIELVNRVSGYGIDFYVDNGAYSGRIGSGGAWFINRTSTVPGFSSLLNISHSGGSTFGIMLQNTSANTSNALSFINNTSGSVGAIQVSSTVTSYITSSDYRLKHDIRPLTGALAKVQQLKPVTYKWNADDSEGEGFIAHELAEVCPSAVTGEKDAVNEDGSIKAQGVDTSFLVATLTAAIQEQQAIIQSLQARLDAAGL